MNKYTLFISDVHLNVGAPKRCSRLLKFLSTTAKDADALYILGDFFDYWAGDDDRSEFNQRVKGALKRLSNDTPIYLLPGNRDFLLGRRFGLESGCHIISEPYVMDLYGTVTLLFHGDIFFRRHTFYRCFRRFVNSPFRQRLFLMLPLGLRLKIAELCHQMRKNRQHSKEKGDLLGVAPKAIIQTMERHQASLTILGHIHRSHCFEVGLTNGEGRVISVGGWDSRFCVLRYSDQNHFEFVDPDGMRAAR